jgi:phosphatidylserine/phosphatidylglycerophosphate/cardiolipin synthase-like enzyme
LKPSSTTLGQNCRLTQSVLSSDLWKVIRAKARTAKRRKAAIAYVTQELVRFPKGDVLVTDASEHAIACGETDASLLRILCKREVRLYHCAGLHAKVFLLDGVTVISSGNMSKSSDDGLVEAGLVTDHGTTVSAVASFIEQVIRQSEGASCKEIAALCKIKVVRRDAAGADRRKKLRTKVRPLGHRTWLVGVRELVRRT